MVPWMPFGGEMCNRNQSPGNHVPCRGGPYAAFQRRATGATAKLLGAGRRKCRPGPAAPSPKSSVRSARDASTVTCPGGPPAPSELLLTLIIGNLAATPASRREPKESGRPRQHAGQGRDPSRTSWRPRQRLPRTCQSVRRGRHRERAGTDRDSVRRTSRGSDRRRRSRSPATSLRILLPQCSFDSSSAVSVGARHARRRLRDLTSERTAGPRTRPGFP